MGMPYFPHYHKFIDDLKIEVLKAQDSDTLIDCLYKLQEKRDSFEDTGSELSLNVLNRFKELEDFISTKMDKINLLPSNESALDKFLDEVLSLRVKVVKENNIKYLDISEYDQHKSNYQSIITKLRNKAITEILNLSLPQIINQVKHLNSINDRFKVFWDIMKEKQYLKNEPSYLDFILDIKPLFRVDKHEEGLLPEGFIYHILDAIMFKHGSIKYLISHINNIISTESTNSIPGNNDKNTLLQNPVTPEPTSSSNSNEVDSEHQSNPLTQQKSHKQPKFRLGEQKGKLDLVPMGIELEKLPTISQRLDHWNKFFIDNIVNPATDREDENRILLDLFGADYELLTWLHIPTELYERFFKPFENTPEFTFWFLIRNAKMYFPAFLKDNHALEKFNSPLANIFIEAELKQLNNFEERAEQLLLNKEIDIYKNIPQKPYIHEIEYLRLISDYYQTHVCRDVHMINNSAVVKYASHILYKEFLFKHQSKSTTPKYLNNINKIPPTDEPSKAQNVTIQSKLTLNEYKEKLDFTLGYYEAFFLIVNAIKMHDIRWLNDRIDDIKQKESEVLWNSNFLTEQVHFDLTAYEVAIFYKYGFKKIEQILNSFNSVSEGMVNCFEDVSYNRSIHKLWHKHNNIGNFFILYSGVQDTFIKDLNSSLIRTLIQFKEDFSKSYSISSKDNLTPDTLEVIQDKHPKANFAKSAPSIPDLSDTKQITMQILDIFDRFDNFNFIIEDGKSKIIDLEELSFSLYNQISIFEKQLMGLHLNGNESILSNVKKELLKKKDNLDGIDFGISLSLPGAENTKVLIVPESVKLVNQIKLKYLNQLIQFIDNLSPIRDNSVRQKNKKINLTKPFFVYILHSENIQIAKSLKSSFTGKKGKTIRLMIDVLANQTEPLINYENRQRKEIYEAMKLFFNWDIGTYQSIWDYKRENDLIDYKAVEAIVLQALTSIKNDK